MPPKSPITVTLQQPALAFRLLTMHQLRTSPFATSATCANTSMAKYGSWSATRGKTWWKGTVLGLGLILGALPFSSRAQFGFFQDVGRASATRPAGSARTIGMGGVGQALGGDMAAFTTNPAGLGWYNHTELGLGIGITGSGSTTKYLGTNTTDNFTNFNVPNLSWVYASEPDEDEKWLKGWTMGVALSRQQDFNQGISWNGLSLGANDQGMAVSNGLVQYFQYISDLNGIRSGILGQTQLFPLEQQIRGAYGIYMLDTVNNRFTTFVPPADYQQSMNIRHRGARMTVDLGGAINIADVVTLGVTIGPAIYSHRQEREYQEQVADVYYSTDPQNVILSDSTYRRARFVFRDKTATNGLGLSARLGAQVNITDELRWGGTLTLPTVYGMSQVYDFTMEAFYPSTIQTVTRGSVRQQVQLPSNPNRPQITIPAILYTVTTPWQFSSGLAYRWGKKAIITADADYIDYSSATIGSTEFSPLGDNNAVKEFYQSAINWRIGGEYRLLETWRIRAGYAFYGSPYKSDEKLGYYLHRGLHIPSLGFGTRNSDRAIDLGVSYTMQETANTAHRFTQRANSTTGFLNVQATAAFFF